MSERFYVHEFTEAMYRELGDAGQYNVVQFFPDGSYEYVRERVSAEEAAQAFHHYSHSVGAQIGTTVRVIITDSGDCTNAEWVYGEGLTFPKESAA